MFNHKLAGSFSRLMLAEFFFMAGYIVIKVGLALILKNSHFSLMDAYSISTMAAATFAVTNLIWGLLSPKMGGHKGLMQLGVIIACIGFTLIISMSKPFLLLALSLFVMGCGLYNINISLFVNKHFECQEDRQQGNNIYHVVLNCGALLGVIILVAGSNWQHHHAFFLGTIAFLLSLAALMSNKFMAVKTDEQASQTQLWQKFFIVIGMVALCYLMINLREYTRILIGLIFMGSVAYILRDYVKTQDKRYLRFLLLICLCAIAYWLAIAVYYNQFSVFIDSQVDATLLGRHFSPLTALLIDPFANMVFGMGIIGLYAKRHLRPNIMLALGLVSLFLAFFVIANVHYLYPAHAKLPLYWVIISISFIAIGEFLIFPTLQAQVSELVADTSKQGFYMGMIQLSSAVGAVLSYYFIRATHQTAAAHQLVADNSYHLYTYMYYFIFVMIALFFIANRLGFFKYDHKQLA